MVHTPLNNFIPDKYSESLESAAIGILDTTQLSDPLDTIGNCCIDTDHIEFHICHMRLFNHIYFEIAKKFYSFTLLFTIIAA